MTETTGVEDEQLGSEAEFEELLAFVRDARGFDFTGYKRPSLRRRIAHRMEAIDVDNYVDYRNRLAETPREFEELFNTILINVTTFFRDPASWKFLGETIVPKIVGDAADDAPIRIWSAGCATGEEAFSLAMLFAEQVGVERFSARVKIYATDVDEDALTNARHARFDEAALDNVPPELRERYFERVNGSYVLTADLRRCVIFGRNDLIADPPISRIDLIAARNTLMYFAPATQTKILQNFHFALNPEGYLFLGRSEMLLTRSKLFEPVDLKRRVFAKVPVADFREGLRTMARPHVERAPGPNLEERVLTAGFESAPLAQLVVDRAGRLAAANVQARTLFGIAVRDLGRPLQDLEISYRPVDLRSGIDEVRNVHHTVALREIEWVTGGEIRWFDVHLTPLHGTDGESVGVGITFTETTRYRALRQSLEHSKERLETAYEELQSTAEELETTNEELQSTNEELETMNEELQSTNEELHTINDELRERTDDLDQVNAFMESILGSLGAGVVVTDEEFHVQAWNQRARDLWGLTPDEVHGQHLTNLDIGLTIDRVMPLLRAALSGVEDGREAIVEAVNRRGRTIQCRLTATPLTGADGETRGVILLMRELAESE